MKAISLWQPWASLVALGAKKWETRNYRIYYRGTMAIHAAQKWNAELKAISKRSPFSEALGDDRAFGAIVAVVDVTDCIKTEHWLIRYSLLPDSNPEREYTFGNYNVGRFAWKLENVRKLTEPLPLRGMQSIWTLDDETVAEINRRMR